MSSSQTVARLRHQTPWKLYSQPMRRWLALFLLCLLPLQVSWAAVADYCSHEHGSATQHFGHHDDEHEVWTDQPDDAKQQTDPVQTGKSSLGHDHSHLSGFLALLHEHSVSTYNALQPALRCNALTYPSIPPDRPERPNWPTPA